MVENLIFYGVCLCLSLLALGGVWPYRKRYKKLIVAIFFAVPAALVVSSLFEAELLRLLDIRNLLSYSVSEGLTIRGRFNAITSALIFLSIVTYFVVLECLLIESFKAFQDD